ncbi:MAG: hypothetical protein AVDCRST_MAG41-3716 [uncultured Corynebacteriales bacterium]|uniref:Uncharacterized protein n=1 Tax=uncultured Mycobacteriales bacterium TaxID=581187 RepID=A0A6J4JMJ6_9ACTN|nr:MAG: hypothetical protein AVDCRST_MAG41-3716 [uncultured Corynebacteriales bacterium]
MPSHTTTFVRAPRGISRLTRPPVCSDPPVGDANADRREIRDLNGARTMSTGREGSEVRNPLSTLTGKASLVRTTHEVDLADTQLPLLSGALRTVSRTLGG